MPLPPLHHVRPAVNWTPMIRSPVMEQLHEAPPPRDRWLLWLTLALILSLGAHLGFVRWASDYQVETRGGGRHEKSVAHVFKVSRVEMEPPLPREEAVEPKAEIHQTVPEPLELPAEDIRAEQPKAGETPAKPAQIDIEKEPLPQAGSAAAGVAGVKTSGGAMLQEDLDTMREALLADAPASTTQPAIELAAAAGRADASGSGVPAGYSNLDDLLASSGGLSGEHAPIFMPSDVLFGYDESFLQAAAIESLQKLGELIRRNPRARFRIEGHTDSFGGPEYNARLSLARAESVRQWLAEHMSIPPDRIDTRGLGSARPLAPLTGTIEEQKLNRRVEIVILSDGQAP